MAILSDVLSDPSAAKPQGCSRSPWCLHYSTLSEIELEKVAYSSPLTSLSITLERHVIVVASSRVMNMLHVEEPSRNSYLDGESCRKPMSVSIEMVLGVRGPILLDQSPYVLMVSHTELQAYCVLLFHSTSSCDL